jgi:hypothetical protein
LVCNQKGIFAAFFCDNLHKYRPDLSAEELPYEKEVIRYNVKLHGPVALQPIMVRLLDEQGSVGVEFGAPKVGALDSEKRGLSPPGPPNDGIRVYFPGGGRAHYCDLAQAATCDSQVPVKCPEYPVLSGVTAEKKGQVV